MAAFSKKHYILLSSALNATYEAYSDKDKRHAVLAAADSIGAALAKDNPMFRWDHFIAVVKGEKDAHSQPSQGVSR